MKTPKLLAAVPILALSASAVIAWSAITRASQTEKPSEAVASDKDPSEEKVESPAEQARIARMDREKKRISERLGVSSPMEREFVNGKDILADVIASGYLIETTLDEVEAALKQASQTADLEDDKAALELMHRGTFRFFAPE